MFFWSPTPWKPSTRWRDIWARRSDASSCINPIWTTSKSTWSLSMRIEPKDFQDSAVLRLIEEIESARREIDRGRNQAVVLSSPTGSGKTVIMTLLMERLWAGHESIEPDTDAIFLWISDSPELNIQSKEKIEAMSDVFPFSRLVIIDNDFDRE